MASLDSMAPKGAPAGPQVSGQPQPSKAASGLEELDLEIAVKLGTRLMKDAGGLKAVEQAMQESSDPVQAISKFLVQLISQIHDSVAQQGIELSPNIVLAQGGWVEQMLDAMEAEMGLPPEFSDEVFSDVVETFKALAQGGGVVGPQQGGAPNAQAQQMQAGQQMAQGMATKPAGVM